MTLEAWWIVILSLAIASWMPEIGGRGFCAIERAFTSFAQKRTAAIIAVFLGIIVIRVVMLLRLPVPAPFVHDEFANLVQADMFAHGRLAYPPHPMARYLETFYINFSPTYSSMFPPAQGAVLAFGQLLGHPWMGVLLSSAAMSAAVLWMLQGWLPAQWALLGTILMMLRIGVLGYWVNSYWGGAVAATGAALVMGALPRIQKHQRVRDAMLMGIGAVILANSRPLEGFLFCVPVAAAMGIWLWKRRREGKGLPIRNVIVPISTMLALLVSFTLYYNWRITNNPFEIPHLLYIKQNLSVPLFLWQSPLPAKNFTNPQFHQLFDVWLFQQYNGTWMVAKRITWLKVAYFWEFFLGVFMSVPLVAFPRVVKERKMRLLVIQFAICAVGLLAVTWFMPHYAAPLTATTFLLIVLGLRHLRQWGFHQYFSGINLSRAAVVSTVLLSPIPDKNINSPHSVLEYRQRITAQLRAMPGDDLIIVHYSANHDPNTEWVYNAADVDHAKIVWSREIPGVSLQPLLSYFHDRHVWILNADGTPPTLSSYTPPTDQSSIPAPPGPDHP